MLLERAAQLAELQSALESARAHAGRIALIGGEAGAGKSSLVHAFVRECSADARVLWGGCEALFTPRPLGPLYDISIMVGGALRQALESEASRRTIFASFLDALSTAHTLVVIEDVHWADEATLDLLKFVGRRISTTRAVLAVTYRDDEIGPEHPLRTVLGDLPHASILRLSVPPLSRRAVEHLATAAGQSSAGLYERTAGNAFFVTEVLAAGKDVPPSVRDAVLARVQSLSIGARSVLQLASVVPARVERWLIEAALQPSPHAVDECLERGLLRVDGECLAFRHELAREAVQASLPHARRAWLHAQIYQALAERPDAALARLVHHADHAERPEAVLRHAPAAGRQAATLAAHREAAAYFATALRYACSLPAAERLSLLEACAYEYYLTGQIDAAVRLRQEVLELARAQGDRRHEGEALRWLSRLAWFQGRRAEAERFADSAIAVLEAIGPCTALAMAYSNRSQLHMLAHEAEPACTWGRRALELADRLAAVEIRVHALNNIGTALLAAGDPSARGLLEESLALALEHKLEEHAARAWTNLASEAVWLRNCAEGARYLDDGVGYCIEHDLDTWRDYMLGWRAELRMMLGQWEQAGEDAEPIVARDKLSPLLRLPAMLALARLRVRRGEDASGDLLAHARELALPTGEPMRILPLAAIMSEAATLSGDDAAAEQALELATPWLRCRSNPWLAGEIAYWRQRSGRAPLEGIAVAEPWSVLLRGDWRTSATLWEQAGFPFERALALSEGDESAQRQALQILEELGAAIAANWLRRRLRAAGVQGLPRGPRATTRAHPAGLTRRQVQILVLVADGLTDAQISRRLHLSVRTVGHHVSAILAKLEVKSRQAAAQAALARGWLDS